MSSFFSFADEEFYETSPYEPLHPSDEFRLASIISGKIIATCLIMSRLQNKSQE